MDGTDGNRAEGDGARVVLVDATGDLERRFGSRLVEAGFAVETAGSVSDCVGLVEEGGVDAVVSEHAPSGVDGLLLLRSIRVSHPSLPFVLVPHDGSERLAADALAAEVSEYVPADADPSTLVARLGTALDRGRPVQEPESQRRYRSLVEMSPAPINLFDADGRSIWGNDAILDLLGLDGREELVGRSIFEFIHPDDHGLAEQEVGAVIDGKESVGPTRMRLLPPDGEVRHIQVSTAVGRVLGADIGQAVIVDITELHATQEELRAEQRLVENALDALGDVFYVVDADGGIERWNERALEVSDYTGSEFADLTVGDLFDERDVDRVVESIETTIEEGYDVVEARIRTKAGGTIPYEFRGRRLVDSEGEAKVVGIGRDVSTRKERERQLKVLGTWLRHNIRNDLNVVSGLAEDIERVADGDVAGSARRIQAHADHLVEQADRERRLIDLLTDPPDPMPLDVRALVDGQVARCRERFPDADIAVSDDAATHLGVTAVPELGDAVAELIENAVEHSDRGTPTVRVGVRREGGRGVVRVADDGPGIPTMEREVLLFERDMDQIHHGAGLGLVFVHWLVRLSGGDIDIADREPRGSVVTLSVPTTRDDRAA